MERRQIFAVFVTTLLLVDCGSAGILQSLRDAAMLKAESIVEQDAKALELEESTKSTSSNQLKELTFMDQIHNCPPGDFLCLAQKNMKSSVQNEMSNAIVRSVAQIMTEMLNSTITHSLKEMMSHAQNSKDPKEAAEARAAMTMVTSTMAMVSSKVIQAFAYFIKVSISGAMWDLFHHMMRAAARSAIGGGASALGAASSYVPRGRGIEFVPFPMRGSSPKPNLEGIKLDQQKEAIVINPSSFGSTNELKRSSK